VEARRSLSLLIALVLAAAALWAYGSQRRRVPSLVPIRDGATIDFSRGAASVRDGPEDKAAIDAAVKKMDEASKSVVFTPDPPKTK
jgi:hypothetical protein